MNMVPIAIVGIDGRFPRAESVAELWRMLVEGQTGITVQSRWDSKFIDPYMYRLGTMISDRLGQIDGIECFDEEFFAMSSTEAGVVDPQQRLLLQSAWRALEDSGRGPSRLRGCRVGVWVGAGSCEYATVLYESFERCRPQSAPGVALSMLANRLSRHFDLRGPSVVVDAGCCSVAVALDQACRSIAAAEVDMAIVGGVNAILSPFVSVALSQGWVLSARGECRPFDEDGDGYVRGEGVGVFVLRRLEEAVRDGDPVLATIRGVNVAHCGRAENSASNALERVMRACLAIAHVTPQQVGYVEAYGIGSPATDEAESAALAKVFARVQVGSIKANIGHLEWASGCASIAKLCSMFKDHVSPPQIHLSHPIASFDPDVLTIARAVEPFNERFAITNAISMGGVCASILLESPDALVSRTRAAAPRGPHIIAVSAPDRQRLNALGRAWSLSNVSVADAAWTLAQGRERFAVRGSCVIEETTDIVLRVGERAEHILWAFSGQGSQRLGMGLELADKCAPFATALKEAGACLSSKLKMSIEALLTHPDIDNTRLSQPALFALQYALSRMLSAWNIRPTAVVGHSVGEIAACVVAGLLTLDEAASFVSERALLMGGLPPGGGMMVVFASLDRIESILSPGLAIAAINGPDLVTVSGRSADLEIMSERLARECIGSVPLKVSHAFHSPLMDPIVESLASASKDIPIRPSVIPWYSTASGTMMQLLPPRYWASQVRKPVLFGPIVSALPSRTLILEVGPGATLVGIGRRSRPDLHWVPTLPTSSEWCGLLHCVAAVWNAGYDLDLAAVETDRGGRVVHGPLTEFRSRVHWPITGPHLTAK